MKILVVLLLTAALSSLPGCSTLRTLAENYGVPEKAARAVDSYCEQVPEVERLKNRATVNALTTKGDAVITCIGDQ